jgi:hypothetical protein
MSELDELRTQNKELKRLLENALDLLEKSKLALTRAQSPPTAINKQKGVARSRSKPGPRNAATKKKRKNLVTKR